MPGNMFGSSKRIGESTDDYTIDTIFGWLKRIAMFVGAVTGGFNQGYSSGFAIRIGD